MTNGKRILVYLANGAQGGAVARQDLARGYGVRALVRDSRKSESLKAIGVEVVCGDLQSGAGLREAHEGVDYVALQVPLGPAPQVAAMMDNAIAAIAPARANGVVVKMANANPAIGTAEPGFAASQIVVDRMRNSGLPFSVIRPTMYLDNFLRPDTRSGIAKEDTIVYPLPAHQRIAWTCADDTARAALTFLDNEAFGVDRLISGPVAVDGDSLALAFSQALNRPIAFRSLPLDAFEREVDSRMGDGMGKRVGSKFRFFENNPDEANRMLAPVFQASPELRGFLPTNIRTWASDRALLFA